MPANPLHDSASHTLRGHSRKGEVTEVNTSCENGQGTEPYSVARQVHFTLQGDDTNETLPSLKNVFAADRVGLWK